MPIAPRPVGEDAGVPQLHRTRGARVVQAGSKDPRGSGCWAGGRYRARRRRGGRRSDYKHAGSALACMTAPGADGTAGDLPSPGSGVYS